MYRVIDLLDNEVLALFFDLDNAEDYLKECGLGTNGLIQQVNVVFNKIEVLKRNVK